jgi:hypothetical protein
MRKPMPKIVIIGTVIGMSCGFAILGAAIGARVSAQHQVVPAASRFTTQGSAGWDVITDHQTNRCWLIYILPGPYGVQIPTVVDEVGGCK